MNQLFSGGESTAEEKMKSLVEYILHNAILEEEQTFIVVFTKSQLKDVKSIQEHEDY